MFPELKNNDWRPTASLENLRFRAKILEEIRAFFAKHQVLEVETPLLAHSSVPDPHIESFSTIYQGEKLYLQTSPEFAMKRLLAAGSGAIYQICKAFRQGEKGYKHNPEFTMLEWYQPNYDLLALMHEVEELLIQVGDFPAAKSITYADLFQEYLGINPHQANVDELQQCAQSAGLTQLSNMRNLDKDGWLFLLMSHLIEPQLGHECPLFVYNFPSTQAALARIKQDEPWVSERFEVFIQGVELANGFYELAEPNEQRQRFIQDLTTRKNKGLDLLPLDENFLAALVQGLPDCSGVALGIDRLIMLLLKTKTIDEVLSFSAENA